MLDELKNFVRIHNTYIWEKNQFYLGILLRFNWDEKIIHQIILVKSNKNLYGRIGCYDIIIQHTQHFRLFSSLAIRRHS